MHTHIAPFADVKLDEDDQNLHIDPANHVTTTQNTQFIRVMYIHLVNNLTLCVHLC